MVLGSKIQLEIIFLYLDLGIIGLMCNLESITLSFKPLAIAVNN